jgi:hypothetical protein
MSVIGRGERTCDRCAQRTADWATIDEAYICAECRAEIAAEEAEVEALREQLRGAAGERNETFALLAELYDMSGASGDLAERVNTFVAAHEDEWRR